MIVDKLSAVMKMIRRRKFAYNMVFARENKYTHVVLTDLARFCRAHETTFHQNDRMHAILEGRREVFLKIQQYLNLTEDEIYQLHKIKDIGEQK